MKFRFMFMTAVLALIAIVRSSPSAAQSKDVLDSGILATIKQFNLLDQRNELLAQQAAGMLIFPHVTKGGVALASEYGEGGLQVNGAVIDYYSMASASVGLTAGMATHSEVILFMTREALDKFTRSKGWSVGADTGIAVVSKGRTDDYDSTKFKKPIVIFVFAERGLIADVSVRGTKINRIKK